MIMFDYLTTKGGKTPQKIPKEYQIRHQNTKVFKYLSILVFKYESIECMQAFKFAILEFDQLLTHNVKARDPVGSKNVITLKN